MKLEKLTITARASLNYQVAEVSLEVSDFTKEDMKNVEASVISESVKMVKKQAAAVGTVEQNQKPEVQVKKTSGYQPKMASDGQKNFLRKLGYTGPFEGLTSKQASELISQLKENY